MEAEDGLFAAHVDHLQHQLRRQLSCLAIIGMGLNQLADADPHARPAIRTVLLDALTDLITATMHLAETAADVRQHVDSIDYE